MTAVQLRQINVISDKRIRNLTSGTSGQTGCRGPDNGCTVYDIQYASGHLPQITIDNAFYNRFGSCNGIAQRFPNAQQRVLCDSFKCILTHRTPLYYIL